MSHAPEVVTRVAHAALKELEEAASALFMLQVSVRVVAEMIDAGMASTAEPDPLVVAVTRFLRKQIEGPLVASACGHHLVSCRALSAELGFDSVAAARGVRQ